jgi:tetratricopeptide (TPR) repeat protein
MAFIKQTIQPPIEARKVFVGRTSEQHFFIQHILKPEDPAYNVVSVWGDAGVGKSTLLTRLIDEARTANFKDSCLTALVDDRQGTPARIMEQWAIQLRMAGYPLAAFENALALHKKALQEWQPEQEVARAAFLRQVHHTSGTVRVTGVPVIGGLYETVAEVAVESFWDQRRSFQPASETGELKDPINSLTRAFVEDLNRLTTIQVPLQPNQAKRGLRVILFFDGFELSAAEIANWLFNHFLGATINNNVALVVASHASIERFIPNEQSVYSMHLAHFTSDETRIYFVERGITPIDSIATIWQFSEGLPLALSLLAFDPQSKIDPTVDVMTNILHWIERKGHIKQQLALHAALFSKPFHQEDLTVFPFLPEQERINLYHWLIRLPFVQHSFLDGRHRYHDLVQQQLSYTLSQLSPQEYQVARRALANYYQRLLEQMQAEEGKSVCYSARWLELALALVYQLFFLPDESSHLSAIEQVITIAYETKHEGEIIRVLHELSQKQPDILVTANSQRIGSLLLHYFEADQASEEFLVAASNLLEEASRAPAFSPTLLARIYGRRGMAYLSSDEYQRAIADFDRALALDPAYASAYLLRGIAYSSLSDYQHAIENFNRALALDSRNTFAYAHRAIANRKLKNYEQAIADFDYALILDPQLDGAQLLRSLTYEEFDEARRGLGDFDYTLELNPYDAQAYALRGMAYYSLNEYQRAIQNLNHALELDPNDAQVYASRGRVYLELGDIGQAMADFHRSLELDPYDLYVGLMLEWVNMSQREPDPETPARLESIAATSLNQYAAYVAQGIALILRERFEEALAELDRAILLDPQKVDAYFWKSVACAFLERDADARAALEYAMATELPLPAVLLTPLRWLEQKRSDFYRMYAMPILAFQNINM